MLDQEDLAKSTLPYDFVNFEILKQHLLLLNYLSLACKDQSAALLHSFSHVSGVLPCIFIVNIFIGIILVVESSTVLFFV